MLLNQKQDVVLRTTISAKLTLKEILADLLMISKAVIQHDYVPSDAEYDLLMSACDKINDVEAKLSYLSYNVNRNVFKK